MKTKTIKDTTLQLKQQFRNISLVKKLKFIGHQNQWTKYSNNYCIKKMYFNHYNRMSSLNVAID